MSRTVVAAHTIHQPLWRLRNLGRCRSAILGHILGHAPGGIFHPHPGNHTALPVFRDVPNFVGDIHVPMNSGGTAEVRISSARLDQQRYRAWCVALVVTEVVEDLELGPVEFLRPVTL